MRGRGHHPHHHPGRGGPGFFGPGPAIGIWGAGRFCRRGPPPVYGRHGYFYNHPGLVIGTAVLAGAAVGYATAPRHHVYVRNRQQITVVTPPTNVRRYYVDIPNDIYPGETFRVVLDGEEVIITCPEISGPGERIMVCVEVPAAPAPVVVTPSYQPARVVAYTSTNTAPVPASAPPQQYQQYPQYAAAPPQPYYPANAAAPTAAQAAYTPVAVPTATPVGGYAAAPAPAAAAPGTTAAVASPFGGPSALPGPNSSAAPVPAAAAQSQSTSVPLSPDVTSCPQCTFFNPSVARFCQMCGGALKAA